MIFNLHRIIKERRLHDFGKMGIDSVQSLNGKSEEVASQEPQVEVGKENVALPMQDANGKPEEVAPQEARVAVSKENVDISMPDVSGNREEAAAQEVKAVVGKENVDISMPDVSGNREEAAAQEAKAVDSKENVDIMPDVSDNQEEAAVQEAKAVVSKENVDITMPDVSGNREEASAQEAKAVVSKENVDITMPDVSGNREEVAAQEVKAVVSKENVDVTMHDVNGNRKGAAPQEEKAVVSKKNVDITMHDVNSNQEGAIQQEAKAGVSEENVSMPMQNVNCKPEAAALQEVQVPVGSDNVAIPVTAYSESEKKEVLEPGKGIEQTPLSGGNEEDVQVNIIGIGGINSGKVVEDASEDCTDTEFSSSSSFGDTGSCLKTDSSSGLSDAEVESPMADDWSEPILIRKKKVTSHWRRFIRPIMWRCKWLELQMRKLHYQQLKYDKEIAAYNYKKQLEFSKYAVDGSDVKSIPISDGNHTNKVMKRKKRKRAEECDLSSYVANHSIFSYYENKDSADGACVEGYHDVAISGKADNIEESTLNGVWYSVDREDVDKSLDNIFQKIEALELQVQKLKTRIDNVVSENPGKFCSVTQLSMTRPPNGLNNSGRNHASFSGNENTFPVSFVHASSQLKSEFYVEDDVLMPGNTLICEGITHLIQTTNRPRVEVLQENEKEELHDFENALNQIVEKTKEPDEGQKSISLAELPQPDLVHGQRPALKAYSSRNPKRAKRKSGSKSGNYRS